MNILINAILIPRFRSVGAAVGTVVAEFAVLAVQFVALRSEVWPSFKAISYWKIIIGIMLGTVFSMWVLTFNLGSFVTLLITAVLFFGVYGLFLLLTKEPLAVEIFNQVISYVKKIVVKKGN